MCGQHVTAARESPCMPAMKPLERSYTFALNWQASNEIEKWAHSFFNA